MYAGFWRRFAALIIDNVLLNVLTSVVMAVVGYDFTGRTQPDIARLFLAFCVLMVIYFLYWPLFESSPMQATPGKMALGIKVTDLYGGRVGFFKALGRNLGKIISGMTLNIGYVMAGFTVRKQALHDKMADCLVIDKNASAEDLVPLAPSKPWFICLVILATLAPYIIIFLTSAALIGFAMKTYAPSAGSELSYSAESSKQNRDYTASSDAEEFSSGSSNNNADYQSNNEAVATFRYTNAILSLISHFQNVYAEQNGGVYAESFAQLEEKIEGFPKGTGTAGRFKIELGKTYVTAEREAHGTTPYYIITKCYEKKDICLYSEDLNFAAEASDKFRYAEPGLCCLD